MGDRPPREAPQVAQLVIRDDGAALVSVRGELDIVTEPQLRRVLDTACAARPTRLWVDLGGVSFCDMRGVNALARAARTLRRHGGRVVLLHPSAAVVRLLRLAGLQVLFDVDGPLPSDGAV